MATEALRSPAAASEYTGATSRVIARTAGRRRVFNRWWTIKRSKKRRRTTTRSTWSWVPGAASLPPAPRPSVAPVETTAGSGAEHCRRLSRRLARTRTACWSLLRQSMVCAPAWAAAAALHSCAATATVRRVHLDAVGDVAGVGDGRDERGGEGTSPLELSIGFAPLRLMGAPSHGG